MIAVNLSGEMNRDAFTRAQAHAVLAVVHWVATNNYWGLEDPVNAEHIAAVRAAWNDRLT